MLSRLLCTPWIIMRGLFVLGSLLLWMQSAHAQISSDDPFEPSEPPIQGGSQQAIHGQSELILADDQESISLGDSLFNLMMDVSENDPIAIFRRGRNLWIVADRPGALDKTELSEAAYQHVRLYEDLSTKDESILRLILDEDINPRILFGRPDRNGVGRQMLLYFFREPMHIDHEIRVEVEVDNINGRPYILIVDRQSNDFIEVIDPEIGQRLVVMPSQLKGYGVPRRYEYADALVFQSMQGSAALLKRDDLRVRRFDFGFTINAQGRLNISLEGEANRRDLAPVTQSFINISDWQEIRPSDIISSRDALLQLIISAPNQKRSNLRLDLARFYLIIGWGAEAEAVLGYALEQDPGLAEVQEYKSYYLASQYMMRRYDEVEGQLYSPEYMNMRDASIWRGAVKAHKQEWLAAFSEFQKSDSLLRRYPTYLRNEFALLYLRSAMALQRYDLADIWIEAIESRANWLTPFQRNSLNYIIAQNALVDKNWLLARELFSEVAKQDDINNQTSARYALLSMDRREGIIDDREMLDALEVLLIDTRQLPLEVVIMRQMVDVLLDQGHYLKAMRIMRTMTSLDLSDEENRELVERMQRTLNDLFLNIKQRGNVLPLRTIAIFDEFRELTPVGERGNSIINGLIQQLIKMDLLDQAEDMLAYQIRYRVFGQERVRLGTKLAVVALLNNNPSLALKALNETQFGNIPREMGRHRRLLWSHALANLGEKDEALKQLAGDISLQADLIRREIFWKDKDWGELAKTIRRLVSSIPQGKTRLTDLQARYIMNWIVALQMQDNQVGVQEVVTQFREKMLESNFASLFSFLVADSRTTSTDAVQRVLADTDTFNEFLDSYYDQLLTDNLDTYVLETIDASVEDLAGSS